MLKAFYQQLRHMAANTEDNFHVHVIKRVGENAPDSLVTDLKSAILLMPDVTSRISAQWSGLREHSKVKELGSYFMTYMYSPKDFIPEDEEHGLFGYIDDAYFVFSVYVLMTEELAKTKGKLSSEDHEFRDKILKYKAQIKAVIADEAAKIEQMIGEILDGEDFSFTKLFDNISTE